MSEAAVDPSAVVEAAPKGKRLDFIDALRGLIICLMVIDHVRDFVHKSSFFFDPLDLNKTSVVLYFTRWITHICAPTFVFLSGVSIWLQVSRGKTGWPLSRFLLTRGLWLIILEVTVVGFGFDFAWSAPYLQVIWAIGFSMIVMAALVWLPRYAVLAIGVIIVAGHHLLDGVSAESLGGLSVFWHLMMQPGPVPQIQAFVLYPAIPWLGIMCLGYGAGAFYAAGNRRQLLLVAAGLIGLFLVLRLPNLYGNPTAWQVPANPALTPLAILDVSKYPPSLDYVLITLGISTLLCVGLQVLPAPLKKPLLAFGRAPLLTYLCHLFVAHGLAVIIGLFFKIPLGDWIGTLSDPTRLIRDGWGLPLWAVYAVWLTTLIILYPISSAYARYRATHNHWWQSYL